MVKRKLVWVFCIALCLFLVYSAIGERGFIRLYQMVRERDALKTRIQDLEVQNSRLSEEVGRLVDDPATIESLARVELGLVKPGEIVLILPDAPGERP